MILTAIEIELELVKLTVAFSIHKMRCLGSKVGNVETQVWKGP